MKYLSKISDDIHLISPVVIEPIITLKTQVLEGKNGTLTAEEILNALCVCCATNPIAKLAVDNLHGLRDCQAHSTAMLSQVEEQLFRKLGVDITSDAGVPVLPPLLCITHKKTSSGRLAGARFACRLWEGGIGRLGVQDVVRRGLMISRGAGGN